MWIADEKYLGINLYLPLDEMNSVRKMTATFSSSDILIDVFNIN